MAVSHDHRGKVVLVTGGTKGIGEGVARAFLRTGADVVVCARRAPDTVPFVDLDFERREATFFPCDVCDPEDVARLMESIRELHGRLDVVINNAGGSPYAMAADASPRLHQRIINLNLVAPLHVAQAAHGLMDEGSIIMIGSVSGTRPSPGTAAYGAAKAGLHHLAACLAVEWAPGIRVNSLVVGLADSGADQAGHYGGEQALKEIQETIPAGRMALPDDIARACLYLASEPYVTGSTLTIDGGGEQPAWQYLVQHHTRKPG